AGDSLQIRIECPRISDWCPYERRFNRFQRRPERVALGGQPLQPIGGHADGIRRAAQFDRDRVSVAAREWANPLINLISSRPQAVHLC
ncbi:hypothetical protein, partial [Rhodoplanes serenus]